MMTIQDVKEAFNQCEYPFYKDLVVHGKIATCKLYSITCDYKATIKLDLSERDQLIHQIVLEIIKLRYHELAEQQKVMSSLLIEEESYE